MWLIGISVSCNVWMQFINDKTRDAESTREKKRNKQPRKKINECSLCIRISAHINVEWNLREYAKKKRPNETHYQANGSS